MLFELILNITIIIILVVMWDDNILSDAAACVGHLLSSYFSIKINRKHAYIGFENGQGHVFCKTQ